MSGGFVLPERRDRRFSNRFPDAWQQMRDGLSSIRTPQGAFCYRSVSPQFPESVINSPHWYVVSYVPDSRFFRSKIAAIEQQFDMGIILLLLAIVPG